MLAGQLLIDFAPEVAGGDDVMRDLFAHYPAALVREFLAFHAANPDLYVEFGKLAAAMKGSGRRRYSSKAIINVLRWQADLRTNGADDFKINDKFQSLYGRLFVSENPDFRDFFEFRVRASAPR